jgi:hypothetical protein
MNTLHFHKVNFVFILQSTPAGIDYTSINIYLRNIVKYVDLLHVNIFIILEPFLNSDL